MSKEWATTDELISGVKKRISRNKRRLMGKSEKEKLIILQMLESDRALLQELRELKRSTGR